MPRREIPPRWLARTKKLCKRCLSLRPGNIGKLKLILNLLMQKFNWINKSKGFKRRINLRRRVSQWYRRIWTNLVFLNVRQPSKIQLSYLWGVSPLRTKLRPMMMRMTSWISNTTSNSKSKLAITVMRALPNAKRHWKTKVVRLQRTGIRQWPTRHLFQRCRGENKNRLYLQRASTECLARWNRLSRKGGQRWSRGGTITLKAQQKTQTIGTTIISRWRKSRLPYKRWKVFTHPILTRQKK